MNTIMLNGETYQVKQGESLQNLMDALQLSNQQLAVAVNRKIIPRQTWIECKLQADDKVEIVRAIGGG